MECWKIAAIWIVCAVVGGLAVYFKQGRYLTDQQPVAFLICGPIALLMAVFLPKSWFTSRKQAEGKR